MVTEITIPKLGLTMEEAKLVKWSLEAGQTVAAEQMVALIETDKVSFEIVSPVDGILYPVVPGDTTVSVAQIIGYVAADEAEFALLQKDHPAGVEAIPEPAEDKTAPGTRETDEKAPTEHIFASPLARRMAKEHDLELASIPGTGPGGRIIEADILLWMATPRQTETTSVPEAQAAVESDLALTVAEEIPIQGIRKVIFENMHLSLSTQAQITLQTEVSASGMKDLRSRINKTLEPDETKVSYNAIMVKAVAMALRQHPLLNSSVDGAMINVWKQIHIGVAMDVGKGLVVPKIRNADAGSIKSISKEQAQLADKARQNTLMLDDLQGGTFTITNLGAWGIDHFTPIVNFPESAILGVGRIVEKPCVKNGEIVIDSRIALSLTFDHRIIDGAPGAMFLKTLTQMIEEPLLML